MPSFKINKTTKILGLVSVIVTIIGGVISWWPKNDQPTIQGNGNSINSNNGNTYNTGDTYIDNKKVYQINSPKNRSSNKSLSVKNVSIHTESEVNEKRKIVILPFEYLSDEKKYSWLSKGIPEVLPEIFLSAGYTVVEGVQRDKVLKEIDFQQGKYVDLNTAVKIGKLLGAHEILIGSYQINGERIIISSRIVNVENSKILQNTIVNHEDVLSDIFTVEKNYVNSLKNKMQ